MTIDLDALRDALERECCGAFYGGGFGVFGSDGTACTGGVSDDQRSRQRAFHIGVPQSGSPGIHGAVFRGDDYPG